MKTLENLGTATTSSVLGYVRAGEAACVRRTAPPVLTVQGTGLPIGTSEGHRSTVGTLDKTRLPFAGTDARLRALGNGGVMGADQVEQASVAIPAVADDPWDPPRRTPSRC